jgi:hypothetical protein
MTLVRVFGNVYLNPSCVGKVEFNMRFEDGKRTSTTTIYDVTGQHSLLVAETDVSTPAPASDPNAVRRDNHVHQEIVAALRGRRDAKQWSEPAPCGIVIRITGSEPQYDSVCEDSRRVLADAYRFEMVEGDISAAMAVIHASPFEWLAHSIPSSDGWFMLFELPSDYDIQVGMEFDLAVGPRRARQ